MIIANERECALECTVCGELEGISRKAMENEATRMTLTARVAKDHARCEELKDRPRFARTEREYDRRLKAEMRAAGL